MLGAELPESPPKKSFSLRCSWPRALQGCPSPGVKPVVLLGVGLPQLLFVVLWPLKIAPAKKGSDVFFFLFLKKKKKPCL